MILQSSILSTVKVVLQKFSAYTRCYAYITLKAATNWGNNIFCNTTVPAGSKASILGEPGAGTGRRGISRAGHSGSPHATCAVAQYEAANGIRNRRKKA
jgi:hypothetical protein